MEAWLVNTNSNKKNGNPNAFKFMLRQKKCLFMLLVKKELTL